MIDFTAHHTILVVLQVAALLFIAYLLRAAFEARAARRHELAKRVLDKMSSEEFLELLRSPDGGRSLERLIGTHKSPDEWVTDAVRRAVFLLFAGIAGIAVYFLTDFSGQEIPLGLGSLSIAVGLGYLITAALTRRRARRENTERAA